MSDLLASPLKAPFRAMFDAELGYVCRSLRRCGIREADIEDLAHDVFLAAHARFDDFDSTRPVRPWLFGIAFRIASHHRRRPGYVREQPTDELEAPDSSPGADVLLEADERRRFLHAAIAQLDDERRAVLVLYDLDGVAMKDIADALSIPLFTAYSRLRAAREDLAAHVHRMRLRQGAKS